MTFFKDGHATSHPDRHRKARFYYSGVGKTCSRIATAAILPPYG